MRMTAQVRSVSALFFATACVALAACSSKGAGPSMPDGAGGGTPDAGGDAPDAAGSVTYWMAERTSEIDLQLVTTQPTLGF